MPCGADRFNVIDNIFPLCNIKVKSKTKHSKVDVMEQSNWSPDTYIKSLNCCPSTSRAAPGGAPGGN